MTVSARIDLEPAYILHARSYRETSQIVEVFTHAHGRMGLVARGARRPKSGFRGLLNPFQPLRVSWSGRGELQTLRDAEMAGAAISLGSDAVLAGFYVNELLIRFLHRNDPHPDLFLLYGQTLDRLQMGEDVEPVLRHFEIGLLSEAGYALNFSTEAITHEPLKAEQNYDYLPEQGPVELTRSGLSVTAASARHYSGAALLAIGRDDYSDPDVRRAARRLLRQVINVHLGDKGLRTRKVAAAMKR